ncbi:MAG: hypothetical protein O7A09_12740 [Proteobacteria bacterium]|nr:hypothetical protein [Pseudomonadota bacterium]MCZ6783063.1 hypothetical protein [Pseudomonadota bacterium]
MQDPERYLEGLGLVVEGAVDPEAAAVLDPAHRVEVNGQLYYVSSPTAKDAFLGEPARFTGRLRDPASGDWFVPTETSPSREVDGRLYLFPDEESAARFDAGLRR